MPTVVAVCRCVERGRKKERAVNVGAGGRCDHIDLLFFVKMFIDSSFAHPLICEDLLDAKRGRTVCVFF